MQTENFRGVYSSKETDHTAQTPGGRERKRYWLVWTIDDTAVRVQPLNASLEPSGERRIVDMDTFISRFRHEPDAISRADSTRTTDSPTPHDSTDSFGDSTGEWHRLSVTESSPPESITGDEDVDDLIGISPDSGRRDDVLGFADTTQRANTGSRKPYGAEAGSTKSSDSRTANARQSSSGSTGSSKMNDSGALRNVRRQAIDLDDVDFLSDSVEAERVEQELRADFGLAVTYLRRGERKKAIDMFDSIAESSEGVVPEHKHVFTDFGISLRKTKLPKQALKHHLKAAELSPADDHACHNIARVYYELGDVDNTVRYLKKSLDLNPALTASLRFLAFIRRNHDTKKLNVDL